MCLLYLHAAQGLSGGPIIAAMYSSGSEVLGGNFVPELFSIFRAGLGLGGLLGPTVAGKFHIGSHQFVCTEKQYILC